MTDQESKDLKKSERKLRKALTGHCEFIRAFLNFMDAEMKKPSTELRGNRIAKALNQLEMAWSRFPQGQAEQEYVAN